MIVCQKFLCVCERDRESVGVFVCQKSIRSGVYECVCVCDCMCVCVCCLRLRMASLLDGIFERKCTTFLYLCRRYGLIIIWYSYESKHFLL